MGNQRVRETCASSSSASGSDSTALEPCVDGDYTLFYVAAFLFGLMDCAIQSNTSAICADDFPGRSVTMYTHDHSGARMIFSGSGEQYMFALTSLTDGLC